MLTWLLKSVIKMDGSVGEYIPVSRYLPKAVKKGGYLGDKLCKVEYTNWFRDEYDSESENEELNEISD